MSSVTRIINKGDSFDDHCKNHWRWEWMSNIVGGERVGEHIRKLDLKGTAHCLLCSQDIAYAGRGFTALSDHMKTDKHNLCGAAVKNSITVPGNSKGKKVCYGMDPVCEAGTKGQAPAEYGSLDLGEWCPVKVEEGLTDSMITEESEADDNRKMASAVLVGICLLSDGTGEELSSLGVVVIPAESSQALLVSQLRQMIVEQVHCCPISFRFHTPQRWPVSSLQECYLQLNNLLTEDGFIYIQQTHERPKIGVKAKTGVSLGFVLADMQTSLAEFRCLVNAEVSFFKDIPSQYQFLDANGWPVSRHMETVMKVQELLVKSCVTVCTDLFTRAKDTLDEIDGEFFLFGQESPRKKLKGLKQQSFRSSKDIDRQRSILYTSSSACASASHKAPVSSPINSSSHGDSPKKHTSRKQLLISYVRAEAADYALQLKTKLAELGYSVYLDVHEISVGVDWQDSLNFAVSNCEVFIPLVTPRYGETLWTNREVKLADVLGKYILPVNFLPDWPPRCLAIQFATTQYVITGNPCSQNLPNGDTTPGCKLAGGWSGSWSEADSRATAMEISRRIKTLHKSGATLLSIPSLVRMKTLRKTFVGKLPTVKNFPSEAENDIPPQNNRPLIVVCLHPAQASFGQELKVWLEKKSHTVWLSSDNVDEFSADETDTLPSSQLQSQGDSQTAKEDNSAVNGEGGNHITAFQTVADRAAVVVIILSQHFATSRTCKQQLFYCEQRKPLVPVHFEQFTMPGWLSMLIGTESSEKSKIKQDSYQQTLLSRLQRVIHSATRNDLEQLGNEAKLNHAVEYIRQTVQTDRCVYIAGSTNFSNPKCEAICRAIGVHLAKLEGLSLATGGFYGAGETVSQAFYEETQRLWKRQEVWHILPDRDVKDWRKQANQNPDSTFAVVAFGKTLFCGDSMRQRDSIIGRCFEICILIEGGATAAHEAEEFVWNDRAVIPLSSTGGAASGKFSLPQKMFETPQGVSTQDWQALTSPDLLPEQIAECITRIVSSLLLQLSASRQQVTDSRQQVTDSRQQVAESNSNLTNSPSTPPTPRGSRSSPASSGSKSSSPSPVPNKSSFSKMKTIILG